MEYLELDCRVAPGGDTTEILIAWLANIGYSMFEETDYGVKAYIEKNLFNQQDLNNIPLLNNSDKVTYTLAQPELKNWNEEWEKNFKPVRIGNDIYVRAEYHPADTAVKYELIIQPRMAFGTGHHATTSLVMERMLSVGIENKRVLDMGCGTGILAILASKLGASMLLAVDNDANAVENSELNCEINDIKNVKAVLGDAHTPGNEIFDVIIANINRNIILEDLPLYVRNLAEKGYLITSGYYFEDLKIIQEKAAQCGLKFIDYKVMDNWCCAVFEKSAI